MQGSTTPTKSDNEGLYIGDAPDPDCIPEGVTKMIKLWPTKSTKEGTRFVKVKGNVYLAYKQLVCAECNKYEWILL